MPSLSAVRSLQMGLRSPTRSLAVLGCYPYFLAVSIFFYLILPLPVLLILGWHYVGGGPVLENIHPATYLLFAAFCFSLAIDPQFRSLAVGRIATDSVLVAFVVAIAITASYCGFVQGASVAPFVDTFIAAIVAMIALSCLPIGPITFLRRSIDIFFIMNIAMIFWETITRTNYLSDYLISVTDPLEIAKFLGPQEAESTFYRPSALFGHPLSAAMFLGVYLISNLISMPARLSRTAIARLILALLAYGAIFPTASRSSMVATTIILGLYVVYATISAGMRASINKISFTFFVCAAVMFVLPATVVMWNIGFFDSMFGRFQYDEGSALTRDYALTILEHSSAPDLWFGRPQRDILAIQRGYGLIAIEISWVNFILVGGLITAIPLFVTYCLFLFRTLRRYCGVEIYFISLLVLIATSSANGIWAKTTELTISIAICFCFLRRDFRGSAQ